MNTVIHTLKQTEDLLADVGKGTLTLLVVLFLSWVMAKVIDGIDKQ